MEEALTANEITALLGAEPDAVAGWIRQGRLVSFSGSDGQRRVRSADLRAFLASNDLPVPRGLQHSRARLLVVDDEQLALDALRRQLRPYADRISFEGVATAAEALQRCSAAPPEVLLVDVKLAGTEGVELLRQIHTLPGSESVKLIAMSARHSAQLETECIASGALGCLPKPIDILGLLALISLPE